MQAESCKINICEQFFQLIHQEISPRKGKKIMHSCFLFFKKKKKGKHLPGSAEQLIGIFATSSLELYAY